MPIAQQTVGRVARPVMRPVTNPVMNNAYYPVVHQQPMGFTSYNQGLGDSSITTVIPMAGAALGAYHGYKRNQSIGWAIGWALLGGMFPLITGGVALAQGFGKKKGH